MDRLREAEGKVLPQFESLGLGDGPGFRQVPSPPTMTIQARCMKPSCPYHHDKLEARARRIGLPDGHPHRYVILNTPSRGNIYTVNRANSGATTYKGNLRQLLNPKSYDAPSCPGCGTHIGKENGPELETLGFAGCRFRLVYQTLVSGVPETVYLPEPGAGGNPLLSVGHREHCTLISQTFRRDFRKVEDVTIEFREWPMGFTVHFPCKCLSHVQKDVSSTLQACHSMGLDRFRVELRGSLYEQREVAILRRDARGSFVEVSVQCENCTERIHRKVVEKISLTRCICVVKSATSGRQFKFYSFSANQNSDELALEVKKMANSSDSRKHFPLEIECLPLPSGVVVQGDCGSGRNCPLQDETLRGVFGLEHEGHFSSAASQVIKPRTVSWKDSTGPVPPQVTVELKQNFSCEACRIAGRNSHIRTNSCVIYNCGVVISYTTKSEEKGRRPKDEDKQYVFEGHVRYDFAEEIDDLKSVDTISIDAQICERN